MIIFLNLDFLFHVCLVLYIWIYEIYDNKIEEDNYYFSNKINLLYLKNFEKIINNMRKTVILEKKLF